MRALFDTQKIIFEQFEHEPFYDRAMFEHISLDNKLTGIVGACGVGKTTYLLHKALECGAKREEALFVLADSIFFLEHKLLDLVDWLYKETDVKLLCIDEIHKYNGWQQELKNIADIYRNMRILFSGSSMIDIVRGKYDLSRRATLHPIHGFSFREYLNVVAKVDLPVITLDELVNNHMKIAADINIPKILKHFNDYLKNGYYPYLFELHNEKEKSQTIENTFKKTIYEDIAATHSLKTSTLQVIEKIFKYVIITPAGELSVNKLAKTLEKSFDSVTEYLNILEEAGLVRFIYPANAGKSHLRNPTKIYPENTNLIQHFCIANQQDNMLGKTRETFFVNHCQNAEYKIYFSKQGDFKINEFVFEIGGKGKTSKQIKGLEKAYVVSDGLLVGSQTTIPLYLFGLLY